RDPLRWEEMPAQVQSWLLAAGGVSAAALAIWFLVQFLRHSGDMVGRMGQGQEVGDAMGDVFAAPGQVRDGSGWSWHRFLVVIVVLGVVVTFLPPGLQIVWNALGWTDPTAPSEGKWHQPFLQYVKPATEKGKFPYEGLILHFGAACALVAV